MFVRKSAFENLVKRCESQQQQIEKLNEMVDMLAKSLGQQFDFNVQEDWNLSIHTGGDRHIDAHDRQDAHSPDWSF